MKPILCFCIAFMPIAGGFGCASQTRPEQTCERDSDCDGLAICDEQGSCQPVACLRHSDCPADQDCLDNVCVTPAECDFDRDCPQGERCEAGHCVTCRPDCAGLCCGGDGCGGTCPDTCAATGQTCDPIACECTGTCEPTCAGRECGPDSCGDTCGPGCDPSEACDASGHCVCRPACTGRECGPDGCGGQCSPGCDPGETCNPQGRCLACQPECGNRVCGLDPVCGLSCGQCDPGLSCSLLGQCGPWCQLGETRCSPDGYGFEACGPDPNQAGQNTWGPRIPCSLGDSCLAGGCDRNHCLETEVMVLLDRSSSMLAGGTWSWVTSGLLTKLQERQARNHFGYREFPAGGGCSVGGLLGMDKDRASAIESAMHDPEMDSATPIAAALQGFTQLYGDPNDGQAVVLISDGDETCDTQAEAVGAAAALFRAGVQVYVVAVTQTANRAFLDQLAAAGGTGTSRLVTHEASLKTALEEIFIDLQACRCFAGPECLADQVFTCSVDELQLAWTEDCPLGCNPSGTGCQTCSPGTRICRGAEVWTCRPDGRDYLYQSTCPISCSQGTCVNVFAFSGVLTNLAAADLVGWTECYSGLYNSTGNPISTLLANCPGSHLLLACRQPGSNTLLLAANAPRADVTYDTGTGDSTHTANGVAWYYSANESWGFALAGDPVHRNTCDVLDSSMDASGENGHLRLCWHTEASALDGGWRCGSIDSLNSSTSYERVIFSRP